MSASIINAPLNDPPNVYTYDISLSKQSYDSSITSWNEIDNVTVGTVVTNIANDAFYEINFLQTLTFDNSSNVVSIGSQAFYPSIGVDGELWNLTLPSSVKYIGDSAFRNQSLNEYRTTPYGTLDLINVETIGYYSFAGNKLNQINLPNTITSIQGSSFESSILTMLMLADGFEPTTFNSIAFNSTGNFTINMSQNTLNYLNNTFNLSLTFNNSFNQSFFGATQVAITELAVPTPTPETESESESESENGCDWNIDLQNETSFWTRETKSCPNIDGIGENNQPLSNGYNLSEKRKAEIFKYKNNNSNMSSKQLYSRLARGIGKQRGQTFATQSATYTNPNTKKLAQNNTNRSPLLCPNTKIISAYTSQNNTPGPNMLITNYPNAPLYNYKVKRQYLAGGTKWPQYGPNIGEPRDP